MPQLPTLPTPRHRLLPFGAILLVIAVLAALVSPVAADLASAAVGDPAGSIRLVQRTTGGTAAPGGCWTAVRVVTGDERTACDAQDAAGEDGSIVFADVGPGTYELTQPSDAAAPGYYPAAGSRRVVVDADATSAVDVTLVRRPALEVTTRTGTGTPVAGACWLVQPADVVEGGESFCDADDGAADGTARFVPAAAGDYTLVQEVAPAGYGRVADRSFTIADDPVRIDVTMATATAPVNTRRPAVTGGTEVGAVLTGDDGDWTGTELTITHRWQRCASTCTTVGAGSTFTVRAADAGATLRFVVVARNPLGTLEVASDDVIVAALGNPTPSGVPTITGVVGIGQRLGVAVGSWTGAPQLIYRWQRCDTAETCVDVAGATGPSFKVTVADADRRLRVLVTGTNRLGAVTVASLPTDAVDDTIRNLTRPSTTGTPKVRETLTAAPGHWQSFYGAVGFTYRWERCDAIATTCVPTGGIGETYRIDQADGGSSVRVVVTATDASGSATAASNPRSVAAVAAPINTEVPNVHGTFAVGGELMEFIGRWSSASPSRMTVATQWERCDAAGGDCVATGDTGIRYVVQPGDVGSTLRVTIVASNSEGSTVAVSAPGPVIELFPPVNTELPNVHGTFAVGGELMEFIGRWSSASPSKMRVATQWERCDAAGGNCVATGDTGIRYVVEPSDAGATFRVVITATNADGSTVAVSPVGPVIELFPPVNTEVPNVHGTFAVGGELMEFIGRWSSASPSKMRVATQWERCDAAGCDCVATGDTGIRYVVEPSDAGATFRVVITATNADGSTVAVSPVGPVIELFPPVNTEVPNVHGTFAVGGELMEFIGRWSSASPSKMRVATQWERCDAAGSSCMATGDTGIRYVVKRTDAGSTFRVVITATNADGSTVAVSPVGPVIPG